jgi:uncharacterized membrane protein YraQ (UPF0718 family)
MLVSDYDLERSTLMDVLEVIWHGLKDSFLMAWEVWWALVFGFAISGIVQAWVPKPGSTVRLGGGGECRWVWLIGGLVRVHARGFDAGGASTFARERAAACFWAP